MKFVRILLKLMKKQLINLRKLLIIIIFFLRYLKFNFNNDV